MGFNLFNGVANNVTDISEAKALNYRLQFFDIYANGWGPIDDGSTLEGPGKLTLLALEEGVTRVTS